jgi:protein-S-isoprenylcysteine O-methyltransferase Ste14
MIAHDPPSPWRYGRRVARGLFRVVVLTVGLFLLAGRLDYWQAWLFAGTSFAVGLLMAALFVGKADLIEERVRPGPGVKWWDHLFFNAYVTALLAALVVAALDAGRFRWSPELPVVVYVVAYAVLMVAASISIAAMHANAFFSSMVRIQNDRGHRVVSGGPYRVVRHPGYVGAILLCPAGVVALGSLWALIPAGVMVVLLLVRTHLEDRVLREELPGYDHYARHVRYRLLPGVW